MGLLSSLGSLDEMRRLQQALEIEYAFQRFAIEKDITAFTLAGLRPPSLIQNWAQRRQGLEMTCEAAEVITFQERLDERIASLSGNFVVLQQLWEITERTREFRTKELLQPALTLQIVEEAAELMNAMLAHRADAASSILAERLQRRCDLLGGQPPKPRKVRLHVVS